MDLLKEINFQCVKECSSLCCGGATILTLDEIKRFYNYFPITIAFQKIFPIDNFHADYLEDFVIKYDQNFIIGDFVAGNRLKRKCSRLKNSLCNLHEIGKPLQCSVIPFSVTFPEEYQDRVINERRRGAFKNCRGFDEKFKVLWRGKFQEQSLINDFYSLRKNIKAQRDILYKVLSYFIRTQTFSLFIRGFSGIFELPIPRDSYRLLLIQAQIENPEQFLNSQKRLIINELSARHSRNPLFSDALREIENVKI